MHWETGWPASGLEEHLKRGKRVENKVSKGKVGEEGERMETE